MTTVDTVTSLPLTHSLLSFYRDKLRDAQRSNEAVVSKLDNLLPELDHLHHLEQSLASSINTIHAFEAENNDMKMLLAELIEENAKLRLGKGHQHDHALSSRLLQTLERRDPVENHASVISRLVARCESLETLVTEVVSDLSREQQNLECCNVTNRELVERLEQCGQEIDSQAAKIGSLPSLQDFEFLKIEVAKLHDERLRERAELTTMKAQNEELRRSAYSRQQQQQQHESIPAIVCPRDIRADECLQQDVTKLETKLKSLERFALKYMPDEHVRGVPEFFQTVDRTKERARDIEDRLRFRIHQRACHSEDYV